MLKIPHCYSADKRDPLDEVVILVRQGVTTPKTAPYSFLAEASTSQTTGPLSLLSKLLSRPPGAPLPQSDTRQVLPEGLTRKRKLGDAVDELRRPPSPFHRFSTSGYSSRTTPGRIALLQDRETTSTRIDLVVRNLEDGGNSEDAYSFFRASLTDEATPSLPFSSKTFLSSLPPFLLPSLRVPSKSPTMVTLSVREVPLSSRSPGARFSFYEDAVSESGSRHPTLLSRALLDPGTALASKENLKHAPKSLSKPLASLPYSTKSKADAITPRVREGGIGNASEVVRKWFRLGPGKTEINGLEIEQLPAPKDPQEFEEQRNEWSKVDSFSVDDVKALFDRLESINHDELLGHHDPLPTMEQLEAHYAHLPKWAIEGSLPKWRSPIDQSLVSEEVKQLWRYIYRWSFIVPTSEGEQLLAELGKSEWREMATEYGLGTSFSEMVGGVRRAFKAAKESGKKHFNVFDYIGMGARSELQVNAECRAFAHLNRPHSLFGIALEVIRTYRLLNTSSSARLVQTFLTHLPLDVFHYSGRVFMFAEVIFAVILHAAPARGGANVLSCGEIDLSIAFDSFLSKFGDNSLVSAIPRRRPLSIRSILVDKGIKYKCVTVGDLRGFLERQQQTPATIVFEQQEEEEDVADPESRARWYKIREQEKQLRRNESKLESRGKTHHRSVKAVPAPTPGDVRTSDQRGADKRKKETALGRIRDQNAINSKNQHELDRLISNLAYENNDRLLDTIRPYRSNLRLYREIVTMFLYRATAAQGGNSRTFDNFFDLNLLASPTGALFESNVLPRPRASNSVSILGFGIDPAGNLVEFDSLQVTAIIDSGRRSGLALRWSQASMSLELLDGGNILQVNNRGRHLVNLVWSAQELKDTTKWKGMAKIIGLL